MAEPARVSPSASRGREIARFSLRAWQDCDGIRRELAFRGQSIRVTVESMEPVLLGLALGAGALYVVKRGRGAMQKAVGWTARRTGWIASRVRSSLDETKAVAREQYERGRLEASANPVIAPASSTKGDGSAHASSTSPMS